MKETKRRMETFSFYDHTGIAAHLARMAERGWLLDKIGRWTWQYRRIEPKTLTFSVNYFPKATQFDPGPSEEQETFYDFCQHTGWTLAAASGQMQVFYNERPDPVPIDTDPALEIDAIHQSARKGWLLSQFSLLAVAVMQEAMFLWQLFQHPVESLSSSLTLFVLTNEAILFLLIAVELTSYYSWRRRAKRAAEQGWFLETRSHPMFQKLALAAVLTGFVWLIASLVSGGDPKLAMIMAVSVCSTFVVIAVIWGVSDWLKRQKASAGANRAVTITLAVVLSIAVAAAIPLMMITVNKHDPGHNLKRDQLPLTLPELLDKPVDDEDWDRNIRVSQSPLLGYLNAYQHLKRVESRPMSHWMNYTVAAVKVPLLYDFCRDSFLNQWDDDDYWNRFYVPADPAPWSAAEAYLEYDEELGPLKQYLLCYPDRMVEIYFDWEVTPEQMAIVGGKLGG